MSITINHTRRVGWGSETRQFETWLLVPWVVGAMLLAYYVIAPRLILLYIYGWTRVQQEHLHLLAMPKGPWPVSNGDLITQGPVLHFAIGVPCWLGLVFTTYPFIRLLLPRRRERDRPTDREA